MVHIVNAGNGFLYANEIRQAQRLRHRVFVEERHWEALRSADGHECDQFDTDAAIHVMAIEKGAVVGYSRLLPTTGPHLLSNIYPELAQRRIPRAPNILEWTRYCVAPEKRHDTAIGSMGSLVLYSVLEYAYGEGVTSLTMETDPIWMTRFFDFGFDVQPLGLPQVLDGEPVIALAIRLSEGAISKCRRLLRLKTIVQESRGTPAPAISLPVAA
jgi:acyl-homoserine lactone synthase